MAAAPRQNGILMHGEPELEDGCGCFHRFWYTGKRSITIDNDDDESYLLPERGEERELWVVKQLKKLKEVSELVAGPKWKNFIRKIGAYFNNNNNKNNKKKKEFQYDSFNYALNFDNGVDEDDEDGGGVLGFSSRFAPPIHKDKAKTSSS